MCSEYIPGEGNLAANEITDSENPIIVIRPFSRLEADQQTEIADQVHELTETADMLTVSKDEVYKKHMAFVAMAMCEEKPMFVGFIGAMEPVDRAITEEPGANNSTAETEKAAEVGTLVVVEEYRSKKYVIEQPEASDESAEPHEARVSEALVVVITEELAKQGIRAYAFCNEKSIKVFKECEYKEIPLPQMPKSAIEICRTECENYAKCNVIKAIKEADEKCCDTPVLGPKLKAAASQS